MKKLTFMLIASLVLSSCATNTTYQTFYKENREDVQFAIGSPAFVANVFIPKEELKEYKKLLKKVRHYKVMLFEDSNLKLNNNFDTFVRDNAYTALVKINDNGEEIGFYYLKNRGLIKEMIVKVHSDNEFVLLGIKTKLYEKELYDILDEANRPVTGAN